MAMGGGYVEICRFAHNRYVGNLSSDRRYRRFNCPAKGMLLAHWTVTSYKRFNEDRMLGNETCRKACTFYMVSEQAKIGVSGEEQVHAAVRGKPFPRLRE